MDWDETFLRLPYGGSSDEIHSVKKNEKMKALYMNLGWKKIQDNTSDDLSQ